MTCLYDDESGFQDSVEPVRSLRGMDLFTTRSRSTIHVRKKMPLARYKFDSGHGDKARHHR